MTGEKKSHVDPLHYLFSLRHDAPWTATAEEYCARAARWQAKACESSAVALAAVG